MERTGGQTIELAHAFMAALSCESFMKNQMEKSLVKNCHVTNVKDKENWWANK